MVDRVFRYKIVSRVFEEIGVHMVLVSPAMKEVRSLKVCQEEVEVLCDSKE